MTDAVRYLSDEGTQRFAEFVEAVRSGDDLDAPRSLLNDAKYSTAAPFAARVSREPQGRSFPSAFDFGLHLCNSLANVPKAEISRESRLWNWLSLYYFDSVCPREDGARTVKENAAYIIGRKFDYRRYYRHLVRSAWVTVAVHGENAAVLLTPVAATAAPLAVRTDIPAQLLATQAYVESQSIVAAANLLYYNPETGRLKRGSTSKGAGTPRRLVAILNQLELTYDLYECPPRRLIGLLPSEFDRFRPS